MGFTISGFTEEKIRDLMNGLRSRDSRGNCDNLSAEMLEMIDVYSECDRGSNLAGRQGFEPRYRGPEPRVLPLDDLPIGPCEEGRNIDYTRC